MHWTSIALVAGEHWVTGLISTEERRVLDIVNDRQSEYLQLAEVRLYLSADLGEPVATLDKAVLPKASILFLMITEERHEAPRKRVSFFVRKDHYEFFATVAGFEVRGYVHLTQRTDMLGYLTKLQREGSQFFPVTDTSVAQMGPFGEPSHAPVTLVNRTHLDVFYLSEAPSAPG